MPFKIISLIETSQSIGGASPVASAGLEPSRDTAVENRKIHDIQDLRKSHRLFLRSSPGPSIDGDAPLTLG